MIVLDCTRKKIFWLGVADFFVTDVISEVDFRPFWFMLPGLGPNCLTKVFRRSFHWKLGSSPSLVSF